MNTQEPIPNAQLAAAHRKLCRRVASMLIRGMAETDTSYAQLAQRTGVTERTVKRWFADLIEGTHQGLREIADIATAMNLHIEVALHRLEGGREFSEPAETKEEAS